MTDYTNAPGQQTNSTRNPTIRIVYEGLIGNFLANYNVDKFHTLHPCSDITTFIQDNTPKLFIVEGADVPFCYWETIVDKILEFQKTHAQIMIVTTFSPMSSVEDTTDKTSSLTQSQASIEHSISSDLQDTQLVNDLQSELIPLKKLFADAIKENDQLKQTVKTLEGQSSKSHTKTTRCEQRGNQPPNSWQKEKKKLNTELEQYKGLLDGAKSAVERLQQQLNESKEIIRRYEHNKSEERRDAEDLRKYRDLYEKRVGDMLNLCLSIRKFISDGHRSMNTSSDHLNIDDVCRLLGNIRATVESRLEKFERIEPLVDTSFDSDEHLLSQIIDGDSTNLLVSEVKKPGYKLDGKIIRKATVNVYRKGDLDNEIGN